MFFNSRCGTCKNKISKIKEKSKNLPWATFWILPLCLFFCCLSIRKYNDSVFTKTHAFSCVKMLVLVTMFRPFSQNILGADYKEKLQFDTYFWKNTSFLFFVSLSSKSSKKFTFWKYLQQARIKKKKRLVNLLLQNIALVVETQNSIHWSFCFAVKFTIFVFFWRRQGQTKTFCLFLFKKNNTSFQGEWMERGHDG